MTRSEHNRATLERWMAELDTFDATADLLIADVDQRECFVLKATELPPRTALQMLEAAKTDLIRRLRDAPA